MTLIWTKSDLPLSKFIRWGLREPVSHFAIVFDEDEDGRGIVFQSNLLGTQINWYNTFKKHVEIVYKLQYDLPLEEEEKIFQGILDQYDGKPYDWRAFLYFIWRGLLFRILKIPFPSANLWEQPGAFLCSGLVQCLKSSPLFLNLIPNLGKVVDTEMTSPYRLYLALLGNNKAI